jgi:spore maturation protein CgeB
MKIIIIGRLAEYNAEFFYVKYLKKLGIEVEIIDMFQGIHYRFLRSIIHSRTRLFRVALKGLYVNRDLVAYIRDLNPDAIIVFRGELISKPTLESFRENFHVYLFYPDVFKFLGSISDRLYLYDAVFTAANFHQPYIDHGAKKVITVHWACDPEFHRFITNVPKIFNVTFIGTAYPERRRIIRYLKNVEVFGNYWWGFGERNHKAVKGLGYIQTINKSFINLNLQTKASIVGDAPTMRTFEIAGCRGFQISDYMPSIKQYLPRMPTYIDLNNLMELIDYYSDNVSEAEDIAMDNQLICYKKFTYETTSKLLLSIVHNPD